MTSPVRTVAIIPARGGSKGVPGKNLRLVGGVPLVARAVRSCRAASRVDRVVVSTDDPAIAAAAREAGAEVVDRPAALAGDTASSESALLHALHQLDEPADIVVLVQCTSPFLDPRDLDRAVDLVSAGGADCAFSAVETYEFLWRRTQAGDASAPVTGVNHDAASRPRRQDREPDHRETGAFYVMAVPGFRAAGHRFFGRVAVVAVAEHTALEIDSPQELAMAEALAPLVDTEVAEDDLLGDAVDALVTDVDGNPPEDELLGNVVDALVTDVDGNPPEDELLGNVVDALVTDVDGNPPEDELLGNVVDALVTDVDGNPPEDELLGNVVDALVTDVDGNPPEDELLGNVVDALVTDVDGNPPEDELLGNVVDALVTDFDGVHTDDHALVDADGREWVRVHRGDGLGVAALRRAGYPLLILSTERNPVVAARAAKLGVEVAQGVDDKATALQAWLTSHGLDPARVAYLGNDVNDLAAMAVVGWPVAVADARPEVRAAARLVLTRPGGEGAVRELCDQLLATSRPQPASATAARTA